MEKNAEKVKKVARETRKNACHLNSTRSSKWFIVVLSLARIVSLFCSLASVLFTVAVAVACWVV